MFVSYMSKDIFVASTPDKLIWYRIHDSTVEEIRRSSHGGRSFSLFSLHDHGQTVFQLEHGPGCYSLRLLDEDGFKSQPVPIPFSWIDQVSADSSGALLAAFGSLVLLDRPGWIPPVESCLIDMESGTVQRLPYTAATFQGDELYFVHERTLYKTRLSSRRSLTLMPYPSALTERTERIASGIPWNVIMLAPMNGCVRVITTDGLYTVSTSGVILIHNWDDASRALVCGDMCFTRGHGPEVRAYDISRSAAFRITSSLKTQVTCFDALGPTTENAAEEGTLMLVSEKGIVDQLSWHSAAGK